MRLFTHFLALVSVAGPTAGGQTSFPVQELAEIGGLGTSHAERNSVDLEVGIMSADADGLLHLTGTDDAGSPWFVRLRDEGLMYGTRTFVGDLDGNGRMDLVIAKLAMGNGRCVEHGDIVTIFFDDLGRPAPAFLSTHGIWRESPLMVFDADGDGHAEFVTSECQYSEIRDDSGGRRGEDRWINGVYEARARRWERLSDTAHDHYRPAVQRLFEPADWLAWFPKSPHGKAAGPETLESIDEVHVERVTEKLTPCGGQGKTHCSAGWGRQIRLSNGHSMDRWPTVVLDRPGGRQVHLDGQRDLVLALLSRGIAFRVRGTSTAPVLWVSGAPEVGAMPLRIRLELIETEKAPIDIGPDEPPVRTGAGVRANGPVVAIRRRVASPMPESAMSMALRRAGSSLFGVGTPVRFSRGGRCFAGHLEHGRKRVKELEDCAALGPLEPDGLAGDAVFVEPAGYHSRIVEPQRRLVRFRSGRIPKAGESGDERPPGIVQKPDGSVWPTGDYRTPMRVQREERESWIALAAPEGPNDMLIGAVATSAGLVAQWSRGGRSWLSVHGHDGDPVSSPWDVPFDAELIAGGDNRLQFLRWSAGTPIEHVTAALRVTYSHQQ